MLQMMNYFVTTKLFQKIGKFPAYWNSQIPIFIIPDWLFQKRSKVLFKLTYCPRNEYEAKKFIDKIGSFTGGKIMLIVLWSTRNINFLFLLKDKIVLDLA